MAGSMGEEEKRSQIDGETLSVSSSISFNKLEQLTTWRSVEADGKATA
jgi:hypothetical protein